MTFKEFAEKAKELRPSGVSFQIQVEVWIDGEGFRDLKWNLWSDALGKHFTSSTPEKVFDLYAEAVNPAISREIEKVGEVSVP